MELSEESSLQEDDGQGRPGLRERKKAKLRQRIIETSLELFKTHGYNETRVADIVEALEISQPTFFRYFPSKDAVLKEMLQLAALAGRENMEQLAAPRDTERRFEDSVRSWVKLLCRWILDNRTLTRAFAVSGAAVPWVNPQATATTSSGEPNPGQWFWERAIEIGQRNGELAKDLNREQLAQILVGMMGHIIFEWASHDVAPYDLAERLEAALTVFLRGAHQA